MVKKTKKENFGSELLMYLKNFVSFKSLKYEKSTDFGVLIYSIIALFVIGILNIFKYNSYSYYGVSNLNIFIGSFFGVFLISLIFSLFIMIFVKAFSKTKVHFFKGTLLISLINLNFILIFNIIDLFLGIFSYGVMYNIFSYLLLFVIIYYLINLVLNISNSFKVSRYEVISSYILSYAVIVLSLIALYLSSSLTTNI